MSLGIFEFQYGAAIAAAFQCALHSVALLPVIYPLSELPGSVMQLTSSRCEPIKLMSKRVSKIDILSVLQNILWCVCPCYKWTIKSCASAIVDLMTCHCFYLQLSSYDLECASLLPAEFSLPFSSGNQESKITSILKQEFGILAVKVYVQNLIASDMYKRINIMQPKCRKLRINICQHNL